jgi:hypothetical protein
MPTGVTECRRQANGDAQEASQFEWLPVVPLKNPIQGFHHQGHSVKGLFALRDE